MSGLHSAQLIRFDTPACFLHSKWRRMTTRLDKTLKRELNLEGRTFIVAVSPEGLKLTLKGKRKGQELRWDDLISGDAALAAALNASVGTFERSDSTPARKQTAAVGSGVAGKPAARGKPARNARAGSKPKPAPRARRG